MVQNAREALLSRAISYVQANGVSDLSLRDLAKAIGTSHRMLIYHFGSKEGLMVAIVQAVEQAQREFFASFAMDQTLAPEEAGRKFWLQVSSPELSANVRLFFELYGQALQKRPGTEGFLDDIVGSWVRPLTDYGQTRGIPKDQAEADARLGVAVIRGLLLDLVATGQQEQVEQAYERYLALYKDYA
ncbi:MAG: TetR/AcrR family transcriptional regulator [Chloroflexi bacterium]|nr:TetR/AcrR family transcriptional regulator [Chloroflexota bacterium]